MMAEDGGAARLEALAQLVEDAPCGILVTAPDGGIEYANGTLARWLNWPADPAQRPARLPELMTRPGQLFYETQLAPMMRLQGFAREISCSLQVQGGEPLPVLLSGVARCDASGTPYRFDYTIFDARERYIYESRLRAARHKADELAAIVRSSPNAILRVGPGGQVQTWNDGAAQRFGVQAAALDRPVEDVVPLEARPAWFREARAACQTAGECVFEAVTRAGRDVEVTIAPIREEGAAPEEVQGYSVVLRDVSDRKEAERRLRVVMGEMRHRIKNTLAVVSGIARQTLAEGDRVEFTNRLAALARAQDVLTDGAQEGAELADLLKLTIAEAGGPEKLRYTGPAVRLAPEHVTSLSMALHELATNALKYGALSVPQGRVEVSCTALEDRPGHVRLVWEEHGGPPVTPPTRRGFGSRMISTVLRGDLGASVEMAYLPAGLRCEIAFAPRAIGPGATRETRDTGAD